MHEIGIRLASKAVYKSSKDPVLKKRRERSITELKRKPSPLREGIETSNVMNSKNKSTDNSKEKEEPAPCQPGLFTWVSLAPISRAVPHTPYKGEAKR
jgi:hypothetical protein